MAQTDNTNDKFKPTNSSSVINVASSMLIPASAIINMSNLILDIQSDSYKNTAENIKNAAYLITEMSKDIIDSTKRSVPFILKEEIYNIKSLMNDIYCTFITHTNKKNLELIVEVNPTVPETLKGDKIHLFMILLNVVGNAVKFTQNGKVFIKVDWNNDKDNPLLIFRIKDTGIGIESHHLEKVFDSRLTGGFGLPLSRLAAEKLGGEVIAESDYGMGSTFTVKVRQKITEYSAIGEKALDDIFKSTKEPDFKMKNKSETQTENKGSSNSNAVSDKAVSSDNNSDNSKDNNISNNTINNTVTNQNSTIVQSSAKVLDTEQGMKYFAEKSEYLEILKVACNDGYSRLAYMKNFVIKGSFDKYINELYSLKSIATNIGAMAFIKLAETTINAYKNKNFSYITDNFNFLIQSYEDVLRQAEKTLTKNGISYKDKNETDYSKEYNHTGEVLMKVADFIDDFDAASAENEIIRLLEFKNVDWIKKQVLKRTHKLFKDSCYQDVKNIVIAMARGEKL